MSAQAGHALTQSTPRRVNCSEYFPMFLATLWVAGIFFHEGAGQRRGTLGGMGRVITEDGSACSPRRLASPRLSQAPQPCADCSTCSHASATSRNTRARRTSGNSGRTSGKEHCWGGSLPDTALRVGGGDQPQGTHGKRSGDSRWADLAPVSGSSPAWEGLEPAGRA